MVLVDIWVNILGDYFEVMGYWNTSILFFKKKILYVAYAIIFTAVNLLIITQLYILPPFLNI